MPVIRTAGIFSKPHSDAAAALVPKLVAWLAERGIAARLDPETALYAGAPGGLTREDVAEGCDLVIVLGGDGTLLAAARALGGREIPLFPVNVGGLGFLTAITMDEVFPELERALAGQHRVGRRKLLHIELQRGGRVAATWEALNDAVVKASLARMIDVDCHVDQMFVCAYKADGLIIATPTGSTAYSLSAGGPIIFPSVAALSITPICPHMLTNRPVIVPETSVVRVVSRNRDDEAHLAIDGQVTEPLKENDTILCRSSECTLHLIRPPRMLFFDVLRQKLKWGER